MAFLNHRSRRVPRPIISTFRRVCARQAHKKFDTRTIPQIVAAEFRDICYNSIRRRSIRQTAVARRGKYYFIITRVSEHIAELTEILIASAYTILRGNNRIRLMEVAPLWTAGESTAYAEIYAFSCIFLMRVINNFAM